VFWVIGIAHPHTKQTKRLSISDTLSQSGSASRIFSSLSWMFVARVINASSSLVYLAAMTRSLTIESFGIFSIITATAQLVYGLLNFNTWQIMVQYGTAHIVSGDRAALSRLTVFCMLLEGVSALAGLLLIIVFYPLIQHQMGWNGELATIAFVYILFFQLCFRSTPIGLMRIGEFFREATIAEVTMPVLRLIGAVLAVLFSPTLTTFLVIWGGAEMAMALCHWYLALKRSRLMVWQNPVRATRQVLSQEHGIWRFAWITNIGTVLGAVDQQIVMMVTGAWLGPVAAGLFRIGYQLGRAAAAIVDMISRTLYTEFNRLHASRQMDAIQTLLLRTNRLAMLGGAISVSSLLIFGREMIRIVAGPDYIGAYAIVVLMGLASVIDLVCASYQAALTTHGHAGTVLIVRIVSTSFLMVSLYPLIQYTGLNAPAIAVLAATFVAYVGLRIGMARTPQSYATT
jgi:O-antigen/teichoic acid export membrane protein